MKKEKAIVIGAGINGLVAANYLRRAGTEVLHLEKKNHVGGACTVEWMDLGGDRKYPIPTGASVFGMMQDFIFRDTGLSERIRVYRSPHPKMVYFGTEPDPLYVFEKAEHYRDETRRKWGETGDVVRYLTDLERVRQFLLGVYRDAATPTWDLAVQQLGETLAQRWISGSARSVVDHYFTADRTKIFECMPVTESGPVSLDAPYTAFTIPLMSAGSVLDGYWGYVLGGLWRLPLTLGEINRELGVENLTSVEVESVDTARREVRYRHEGRSERKSADAIFFATDPVSAASLVGDTNLQNSVGSKNYRGSSGKCVLVFKEPVRWKEDLGSPGFDSATRYLYHPETFADFEASNRDVREGTRHFSPCHFQVYVEGGAMRNLGWDEPFDYLSIFFKDFALGPFGSELPEVKREVEQRILARIANPSAFVGSVMFTPKNLQENFFFPGGNIDHIELTGGQTYFARSFSSEPERAFYQFGSNPGIFYCGAGGFPCGSVAGTAGYLASRQWLKLRTI